MRKNENKYLAKNARKKLLVCIDAPFTSTF